MHLNGHSLDSMRILLYIILLYFIKKSVEYVTEAQQKIERLDIYIILISRGGNFYIGICDW
jgi:hypothetical protein